MKQTDRESRTRWIKLTAFFGVLAVLCVIGIFLPRPTESEIETKADRVPGLYLGKLLEWKVV